jgi:hypothetical protein
MITHVVLIKLTDPTSENLKNVVDKIRALDGQIDVLRSIEVGTDIIHSARSYDVALVARFDSLEDLKTYAVHPIHVPVLEFAKSLASSMAAVDFES